jgi:hypothetical protein
MYNFECMLMFTSENETGGFVHWQTTLMIRQIIEIKFK